MTFLDPFAESADPIYTRLPDTLTAFQNKYSDPTISTYVQDLPSPVRSSLVRMDAQRVLRGQQPLSKKQTITAGHAARTQQQVVREPERKATNILGNISSDIRQITGAIPHLPGALIQEAKDITKIGEAAGKAKGLPDFLQLPGVRLVPGTYVAANLLRGDTKELATHPLFTALDVLPIAKPAGVTRAIATSRPVTATRSAVARTRPGQFFHEAFGGRSSSVGGTDVRVLSELEAEASGRLREQLAGDARYGADPIVSTIRKVRQLPEDFKNIPVERQSELARIMQYEPQLLDQLPDIERAYVERVRSISNDYANIAVDEGFLTSLNGEFYDKATANKLLKKFNKVAKDPSMKNLKQLDKQMRRTPPARFDPLIEKNLQDKIKLAYGTSDNIDQVTQHIAERNYKAIPGFDEVEYKRWRNEVKATWQEMREQGLDPVFLHKAAPGQEAGMIHPRVLESIPTPSQAKARIIDGAPYATDVNVALSHQGLELLARRGAEEYATNIRSMYGRTIADVRDDYIELARKRAARDKLHDVNYHLDKLVSNEWRTYNPTEIFGIRSPRITALSTDQVLIPKTVANNLRRMRQPIKNGLTTTLDPIMGVFRTSVLPLSPRWHFNNLFGGGLTVMGQTGPGAFKFLREARDLVKTGETTLQGSKVVLPERMRLALGSSVREHVEANVRSGATMNRLMGEVNAARQAGKIKDAFGKTVKWSFDKNAYVDDVYRTAAYLYGYDKSLTKGMTKQAAEAAGEALAKKSLQTWTNLTPIERSVMRYVFPFYGWMQFIARYSLKYPMDHPFRASVMGSFARTEMEDWNSGIPERFLNMFFLGDMNEDGKVKAISIGGANPFRDVANYFTLGGFLGATNPVLTTLAEQLGLDVQTGAPELYPTLRYDAESGRLRVSTGNPVQALVENTLPQSRILLGLVQQNSEFKELMQRDPEAAGRLMRSQLGLPVLFRTVDLPAEIAKGEIAREDAQKMALSEALRTGRDTEAQRYPNLRPLLEQIRTLQGQGQLEQFTPQVVPGVNDRVDPLELAQDAIIRMNVP